MKKLVIIGANDFQNQLIIKAKSLGYITYVFAWEDGAVGKENADYFFPISIVEKEKILQKCKEIKPDGICSIASDLAVITVNYVAENLGLASNKTKVTNIQTNKYSMRQALQKSGVLCPKFVSVFRNFDDEIIDGFRFPIIVKPTDRSGSRSITKLCNKDGLKEAVEQACDSSFEGKAIIEEYIKGDEYSMETISQNGKHYYLATTKKYTTGAPHFIEVAHIEPSDLSICDINRAKKTVFQALDALCIENSAGHSEFKIDENGNVFIVEIGARMGGDCIGSDLVPLSTGYDFLKAVIDVACNNEIECPNIKKNKKSSVHFMFDEEDIIKLEKIKKENPSLIYRVSNIDLKNIGNVNDSSTRLGYYITVED